MQRFNERRALLAFTALCLSSVVAGAQTQSSKPSEPPYTPADVEFMQGMIHHHAQALVMAAMAPTHGASAQLVNFSRKITISQRDEIELMRNWLKERKQDIPEPHTHSHGDSDVSFLEHPMMPGMLTPAQIKELDAANGTEFDRLFLTGMIKHHEGALVMVKTLFDTPGSGQGAEIFGYASGVDADQRAEIERMQGMLQNLSPKKP
jgi:uncharacterized protein (DUF305 family)